MLEPRRTFRPATTDICWQRQLRDQLAESAPAVDLTVASSRVRVVSRGLAEQIIVRYEWLGTMGAGTQRCYGIFFGQYCAGVTTFASSGAIPAIPKMLALPSRAVSYLARGACTHWAPPNTNSRLIAKSCALEYLHGIKIVVAFADTDAGEIGTVYQAANWTYLGQSATAWPQWVSPLGRIWSSNSLTKRRSQHGGTTGQLIGRLRAHGWHEQPTNPKHRYVYIVDRSDRALVARIDALRQPYPKRGRSAASGTAETVGKGQCNSDPSAPL